MAVIQLKATVGAANQYGVPSSVKVERPASASGASGSLTTDTGTLATHNTSATTHAVTVAANVATLVADGAAPTQAHVNTLNTNYALLATDLTNMSADSTTLTADAVAAAAAVGGDVVVAIDLSKVSTINMLKAALDQILFAARGSSDFKP